MDILNNTLFESCEKYYEDVVKLRRHFHMYPETGFDVRETSKFIKEELEKLELEVKTGIGKTGLFADLDVSGAEKRIAFRADMDALDMQELGESPYKSKFDGKAHMCGHDVHIAVLLGVARVLTRNKDLLNQGCLLSVVILIRQRMERLVRLLRVSALLIWLQCGRVVGFG